MADEMDTSEGVMEHGRDGAPPPAAIPRAPRRMLQMRRPSAFIGHGRLRRQNEANRAAARVLKQRVQLDGPLPPRLYPDHYDGSASTSDIFGPMNDLDIRHDGGSHYNGRQRGNNYNPRKRGRGTAAVLSQRCLSIADILATEEDDTPDRRPRRRRYEQPIAARLRTEILKIADDVRKIARR